MHTAICNL